MGNELKLCNKKGCKLHKVCNLCSIFILLISERAKEICYISPNIIPFIIRFTLIFYLFFHSLFIGFILSRTTNIQHKKAFVKSQTDFNRLLSGNMNVFVIFPESLHSGRL